MTLSRRSAVLGLARGAALAVTPAAAQIGTPLASPIASPAGATPVPSIVPAEILYYYLVADVFQEVYPMLYGELRNPNGAPVTVVDFSITLLDRAGDIVDTLPGQPIASTLEPGEAMPFYGYWLNAANKPLIGDWDREELTLSAQLATPDYRRAGLRVEDVSVVEQVPDQLTLTGKVVNGGSRPTDGPVQAYALVYASDGRFAGSWPSQQLPAGLNPGQGARFTIESYGVMPFGGLRDDLDAEDYTVRLIVA